MLEKKAGIRNIHMLWIISLLKADFNTALKFFFFDQMLSRMEATNSRSEKQRGFWGGAAQQLMHQYGKTFDIQ